MSQFTADPIVRNTSSNPPLGRIMEERLSRRTALRGAFASAFTLLASTSACSAVVAPQHTAPSGNKALALGFASLPTSMTDACVVPPGYRATVLGAWGTPLHDAAAPWRSDGGNSSHDLLHATGMHHDGLYYFPLYESSEEGLLVVNHEYIDEAALHPNGPTQPGGKRPAEEVRKEINAHGVSVMHIRQGSGGVWNIVRNSHYNRRFTSATVMDVAGPLAGSNWLQTPFSPAGMHVRGTNNNNCGNGTTPWGTYLTAEENWAMCFVNHGALPAHQQRSGIPTKASRYQWGNSRRGCQ